MTKIIRKPFEILEKTSTLRRDFVQEIFLEGLMQKLIQPLGSNSKMLAQIVFYHLLKFMNYSKEPCVFVSFVKSATRSSKGD